MPAKHNHSDDDILKMLSANDGRAIDVLYLRHHAQLFNTVNSLIKDKEASKDVIQDLFCSLWERRHTLQIKKPIISYLIKSAINRSFNFMRDNKRYSLVEIDNIHISEQKAIHNYPENTVETDELEALITAALSRMPSKSKTAFILSRKHNKTYGEIATLLNISKKAVEKRISKSIKHLHVSLEPYLKGLLALLFFWTVP